MTEYDLILVSDAYTIKLVSPDCVLFEEIGVRKAKFERIAI